MDLAEWLRDRRWRALLELIDQLPPASRFNEARQNDPERAELIAREREKQQQDPDFEPEPWTPRLADWDLHANLLRDLIQSVLGLSSVLIKLNGGSGGTVREYPSPVTEVDKATARLERAWAQGVLSRYGFHPDDF